MENTLNTVFDQSNSILILLPEKPYLDQAAAGLALFLAIGGQKEVSIVSPTPMTVEFNRLIGVNKISQDLGSKNLVIKFGGYKANDIERVSYDIEDGEFKLTVIPKAGVSAPKQSQAHLSYSGVSADTVVLIGGANESHFPALSENSLASAKLVHIGTRALSLTGNKNAASLSRSVSSISELMASLIKESDMTINGDIATNLLIGIQEGTSKFSSNDVTADTFTVVADLMRTGGQRGVQERQRGSTYPQGAIPGQTPKQPISRIQPRQQQVRDQGSLNRAQSVSGSGQAAVGVSSAGKQGTPKDWLEPKIYKGTSVS